MSNEQNNPELLTEQNMHDVMHKLAEAMERIHELEILNKKMKTDLINLYALNEANTTLCDIRINRLQREVDKLKLKQEDNYE